MRYELKARKIAASRRCRGRSIRASVFEGGVMTQRRKLHFRGSRNHRMCYWEDDLPAVAPARRERHTCSAGSTGLRKLAGSTRAVPPQTKMFSKPPLETRRMSPESPSLAPAPGKARGALVRALLVCLVGIPLSGCGYNVIPTLEEQAQAKWADVQNQYQRRADLIPNLVATVQGYAKQEKDVLTSVIEARAKATSVKIDASQLTDPEKLKQFQDAQNQLSGALGRLLAVSENYPDLKSNQNFLALQSQLEGTENRIAVARRDYIEASRAFNTEIRTFPSLIWATILRFKPMADFTATEAAQTPPQVKF
jgi:LemA protein